MTSLQLTTCSKILGRMVCWYISRSTPSSWLSRTRLVPTRIRRSRRSCSRLSRSREWPWCCSRTQSLFISMKLVRTKPIESARLPAGLRGGVSTRTKDSQGGCMRRGREGGSFYGPLSPEHVYLHSPIVHAHGQMITRLPGKVMS
jgi:hypothetical protein